MGRDLRIIDKFENTYDFDSPVLDVIESFFEKSWPKWYKRQHIKNPNFIFTYDLKINRKTLIKLYEFILNNDYNIELKDYQRENLLYELGYIIHSTSKKDKIRFEFW